MQEGAEYTRINDENHLNHPPSCADVGYFSYLTYSWLNPLVVSGYQGQAHASTAPALAPEDDTVRNTNLLTKAFKAEERAGRPHPLLRAVVGTFWRSLLMVEILSIASHLLGLLTPFLLQRVLVFQEGQNESAILEHDKVLGGIQAVAGLIFLGLFNLFFDSQIQFFRNRLSLRMGSALRGAVLIRCVQGRSQSNQMSSSLNTDDASAVPSVYNVISFDVGPNIDIIWIVLGVWLFPIQLGTVMYALFQQVRWAVVPGLLVIICAKSICFVLLYLDGVYRDMLLARKDVRLARCDETFNNIRVLQMLSWADSFESQIMEARAEELRLQNKRLWCQKMCAAIDNSLAVLVTLVTLGYFVTHSDVQLKASVALPVIALVSGLVGPFGQIPAWFNQYLVWQSAYSRVNQYIGIGSSAADAAEDDDAFLLGSQGGRSSSWDAGQGGGAQMIAGFQNCTMSWSSEKNGRGGHRVEQKGNLLPDSNVDQEETVPLLSESSSENRRRSFELQDLTLGVHASELLVVVGREAQGKSSLLHGLLGEMDFKSGLASSPALARKDAEDDGHDAFMLPDTTAKARAILATVADSSSPDLMTSESCMEGFTVPYASQDVMLFTGTIRSNVLFGQLHVPALYDQVLDACRLVADMERMPLGDLTEVAHGGATLSGGQRARIGLARAVYRAAIMLERHPNKTPLILIDDVICSLDRCVAQAVVDSLFNPRTGLLSRCAVIFATADPWWLDGISSGLQQQGSLRLAVIRAGHIVAKGSLEECQSLDLPELASLAVATPSALPSVDQPHLPSNPQEDSNDSQDDEQAQVRPAEQETKAPLEVHIARMSKNVGIMAVPPTKDKDASASTLDREHKERGHVKFSTLETYLHAIGMRTLVVMCASLIGIMVFQNFCTLWITYWTSDSEDKTKINPFLQRFSSSLPTTPQQMLSVYAWLALLYSISCFAGHGLEIIGGINASKSIFHRALSGTISRPFQWWDANPTGRVLNRFSADVEVMDNAVTNILGVIFGAVLYFIGHTVVLTFSNPVTVMLLPVIMVCLEFYARYYRPTIREVQRFYLAAMSTVYQDMVEAIIGKVSVGAFAATREVLCKGLVSIDQYQQLFFVKGSLGLWIGLRMGLIGFAVKAISTLYPVFQYYQVLSPRSAALVGFSIQYSAEVVGVLVQFVMNYSDLEMQLISIERLNEYGAAYRPGLVIRNRLWNTKGLGLSIENLSVTYRAGLSPALTNVSLCLAPREVAAIVGRTGAGKSSLLLSILQLVPYEGCIKVGHHTLGNLCPKYVRRHLVGVVPQQPIGFDGSVRWNLDPEGLQTDAELLEALAAVGLQIWCLAQKGGLDAKMSTSPLSQGQLQLLCAARVLLRQHSVICLDEVTASLPKEVASSTASELISEFRKREAVVLLVTHQLDLLPCCGRKITVDAGKIASDELLSRSSGPIVV
jgi:ABC-type multidrug transport system fused ATPase/permease subunit